MKGLMGLMVVLVVLAVMLVLEPAMFGQAQAVSAVTPGQINPAKNTVIYFGMSDFITGKVVDTLVLSSDRNFADTANYHVAVLVTPIDALGILRAIVLNDSSVIVTSSAAADSLKTYYYEIVKKKK